MSGAISLTVMTFAALLVPVCVCVRVQESLLMNLYLFMCFGFLPACV